MATIYWAGGTDTDIDDFNNYVTSANGTSVISDNSGDFSGDDVIFQSLALSNVSRNPTVNANETFNSIRIDSGCTLTGNASYSITVDGEADGTGTTEAGYAVDIHGALGTNVNIILATNTSTLIDFGNATSGTVHNLTVTNGINYPQTATSLAGNLTINGGTFNTDSDTALTVTGTTTVAGTLICNGSTVILGSGYTAGYALIGDGTVNFGTGTTTVGAVNTDSASGITKASGTITFNTTQSGGASIGPAVTNSNSHFNFGSSTVNFDLSGGAGSNFAIEQHVGSSKTFTITAATVNYKSNGNIYQGNSNTNIFKIIGNFVIDASKTFKTFYDDSNDYGSKIEVTGDVTVNGILNAYSASNPKAMEFGSLTIASGGEYSATSGTTTLKSETSGGSTYVNDGTFTHNNGTLLLHADIPDTQVYAGSSSLYNVTSSTGNNVWLKENITIANDLTITSGTFGSGGGNDKEVTVHGNVFISGGEFGNGSETGAYTVKGLVTLTGGTFDLSSGTINLGGIRNAGGTIS
tara:strand:+ start:780 stop:2348 length:1569 start_codon:yes stop_codon:yes gene_type:complete